MCTGRYSFYCAPSFWGGSALVGLGRALTPGDLATMTVSALGALVAIAFAMASAAAAPSTFSRHEVRSLPGYRNGTAPPPTRHFTGFVEVDEAQGTSLFYYLVESASKPESDPLVWWMNGGPGASSLAGLVPAAFRSCFKRRLW